jgi:nicotinamide-nucleotide amidase
MERLSLVAIGDEVLCGHTVNTNASTVALACTKIGRAPISHTVVGDDVVEMEKILRRELALGGDVIAFGGLGPTGDDRTREVISKIFETPLVLRKEYAKELELRFGKEYPTIKNQAAQPEKAKLLTNSVGTAPGLFLEDKNLFPMARLFVLPGPPYEFQDVFGREVLPLLGKGKCIASVWLSFIGAAEHEVNASLERVQALFPTLHYGIYPSYETVSVHLFHEDEALVQKARASCLVEFQGLLLPEGVPSLEAFCLALLGKLGWTMATAESCTGGAIAARMCSVSGASAVFCGSVVAYTESTKVRVLAVPEQVIKKFDVVSTQVTEHMAENVRTLMGTDVALAVSGYFGPTGGTKKAPLGTVCATLLLPESTVSQTFFFHGSRASICAQTVGALLALVCKTLVLAQCKKSS